jgi:dTDP-4-amino-4,6-dideoxygalactose transaminase
MRTAGIDTRPIWPPVHSLPIYAAAPKLGSGRVSEQIFSTALSLPSSVQLTGPDQRRVVDELVTAKAQPPSAVAAG